MDAVSTSSYAFALEGGSSTHQREPARGLRERANRITQSVLLEVNTGVTVALKTCLSRHGFYLSIDSYRIRYHVCSDFMQQLTVYTCVHKRFKLCEAIIYSRPYGRLDEPTRGGLAEPKTTGRTQSNRSWIERPPLATVEETTRRLSSLASQRRETVQEQAVSPMYRRKVDTATYPIQTYSSVRSLWLVGSNGQFRGWLLFWNNNTNAVISITAPAVPDRDSRISVPGRPRWRNQPWPQQPPTDRESPSCEGLCVYGQRTI